MINEIIGCKTLLELIGLSMTLLGSLMVVTSIEPVHLRYKDLHVEAEVPKDEDQEREWNRKAERARTIRNCGIPLLILGIILQILSAIY
jgi:hypothetical protein